MEDTLRDLSKGAYKTVATFVLILVLMEDTLRVCLSFIRVCARCLNPCFNGRYSQSRMPEIIIKLQKQQS